MQNDLCLVFSCNNETELLKVVGEIAETVSRYDRQGLILETYWRRKSAALDAFRAIQEQCPEVKVERG